MTNRDNAQEHARRPFPKTIAEWQDRIKELQSMLRLVEAGYGIDRHMRPINKDEAKNFHEFEIALELETLMRVPPDELKNKWDNERKSEYSEIIESVQWARHIFRDEGWITPSCWISFSKKYNEYMMYGDDFVRLVSDRSIRESQRAYDKGEAAFSRYYLELSCLTRCCQPDRFKRLDQLIRSGRIYEPGEPIWYAAHIILQFKIYMNSRRYQRRTSAGAGESLSALFRLGHIYGEAMFRLQIERDALTGRLVRRGAASATAARDPVIKLERQRRLAEIGERVTKGEKIYSVAAKIVARDRLKVKPGSLVQAYNRAKREEN